MRIQQKSLVYSKRDFTGKGIFEGAPTLRSINKSNSLFVLT